MIPRKYYPDLAINLVDWFLSSYNDPLLVGIPLLVLAALGDKPSLY